MNDGECKEQTSGGWGGAWMAVDTYMRRTSVLSIGALFVLTANPDGLLAQCPPELLFPIDEPGDITFGHGLAASDELLVVGGNDSRNPGPSVGSAHVYSWDGQHWLRQARLQPSTLAPSFGWSVDTDGTVVVVGDPGVNNGTGAAFVFRRVDGDWIEETVLRGTLPQSYFGWSVAVNKDTVAIGAWGQQSVHVFRFAEGHLAFVQRLVAPSPSTSTGFGYSVDADDDRIVVGTTGSPNGRPLGGQAVVFRHDPDLWNVETSLTSPTPRESGGFGYAVAIHGNHIIIGAPHETHLGVYSGQAHIFQRGNNGWSLEQTVYPSDFDNDMRFGDRVALTNSYSMVATVADSDHAYAAGAAYLFSAIGETWREQAKLVREGGAAGEVFGFAMAITQRSAVVGLQQWPDNLREAVYVYELTAGIDDCNQNGLPDRCEPDCDENGVPDPCDIARDPGSDADLDTVLDSCESLYFVNANATGENNGTSWQDAFVDLQDAFATAMPGDEIWVAQGTYTPGPPGSDRVATFSIPDRVALYGGFVGDESDRTERDLMNNLTILSGDLNQNDDPDASIPAGDCCETRDTPGCSDPQCETAVCDYSYSCCHYYWDLWCAQLARQFCGAACRNPTKLDNVLHVVTIRNAQPPTTLDGFTIMGGDAYSIAEDDYTLRSGGGALLQLADATISHCSFQNNAASAGGAMLLDRSSPTIRDCTFSTNEAESGGGVSAFGSVGTILSSVFERNQAFGHGGAINLGETMLHIDNCDFRDNSAESGGAISNGAGRLSAPRVLRSRFTRNRALSYGGGVYDHAGTGQVMSAIAFEDCAFESNQASVGGGLALTASTGDSEVSPRLTRCTIAGNSAYNGGGLYIYAFTGNSFAHADVSQSEIASNYAEFYGGGIYINGSNASITIEGSTLHHNAAERGGGLFASGTNTNAIILLTNSEVSYNSADYGGAMYLTGAPQHSLHGLLIQRNGASVGGALYTDTANVLINHGRIIGNYGADIGNIWLLDSVVDILNTILVGNTSGTFGGAIVQAGGTLNLTNSTVAGNVAGAGGAGLLASAGATIRNSVLWNNIVDPGDLALTDENAQVEGLYQTNVDYSCIMGWTGQYGGGGNTSDDPLFVTPIPIDEWWHAADGNYHLRPESTLINAGDPEFVAQPGDADLEGHSRILCGRVDMGAYEYGIGDYDCDSDVDMSDFSAWAACMGGPDAILPSPDCSVFDFDGDGDIDLADFAQFSLVFAPISP